MKYKNIDAKARSKIRSALRQIWLYSGVRGRIIDRTRQKGGGYKCEKCKTTYKYKKELQADHIIPVGATPDSSYSTPTDTWHTFMLKLFCNDENYMALCKRCHAHKSKEDKQKLKDRSKK